MTHSQGQRHRYRERTTQKDRAIRRQKEARKRVGNDGKSIGKERRGKRKGDGQVEVERQEARIRAERLNTSQHGKEETQLTRIRDINERTATRTGNFGLVESGVHVVMGERTQDTRTPRGGSHGEGDPGRIGGSRAGDHCTNQGRRRNLGMLLERCFGGRESWAVLGRGHILKGGEIPWRGKPTRGPHQFHLHSPCPALLPCSVSRRH